MEKTKEILQWITKQPEYKDLPVDNPHSLFYHTAPITFARFIERYLNECGGETSHESAALPLHDVNGWLSFPEYSKAFNELIKKEGDCLVKFDDGTILRFKEEFPIAVVTHFKPF